MDLLDELIPILRDSGALHNPRRAKDQHGVVEGEITLENKELTLSIFLPKSFPLALPRISLIPWDALGFIPHVSSSEIICFNDGEGLLLNRHEPIEIILEALERAIKVLESGASKVDEKDFVEEFEAYWAQRADAIKALSVLDPPTEIHGISIVTDQQNNLIYVALNEANINSFLNSTTAHGHLTVENGLFIPLDYGSIFHPPRPDKAFWTVNEVRDIISSNISTMRQKQLYRLLRTRYNDVKYVILSLPRFSIGQSLFGLKFDRIGNKHPLLIDGYAENVIPIRLERRDRSYLLLRGGGNDNLATKRVLLVGCGAVGGHIAFELARAGISDLTLIDPDTLLPVNTYRHVLGKKYWNEFKVTGLKKEIEDQIPYIHVRTYVSSIEDLLLDKIIDPCAYDLIILATGNPTVELEINERIHQMQDGPIVLYTWLDPLGIGGHALLTNNSKIGGCLQCLYTTVTDKQFTGENRSSFAQSGQWFGRALSGCGSVHTPYSSLDATNTAAIATKIAVEALIGVEHGNPLISWKGGSSTFIAQGFMLSNRYNISEAQLFHDRYLYYSSDCPVCHKSSNET